MTRTLRRLICCLAVACLLFAGKAGATERGDMDTILVERNEMVGIADSTFKDVRLIQEAKDIIVSVSEKPPLRKALLYGSLTVIGLYLLWLGCHCIGNRVSRKRKHISRYHHRGLRIMAVLTLISGCVLYYIGFFTSGTASSLPAYFVRPLIASLGMFVGNTTYQEVSEQCTQSPLYMTFFAIVHLAAILISATFIINFCWKRAGSWCLYRYWVFQGWVARHTKRFGSKEMTLNVFFGFGEPSVRLAKSIARKQQTKTTPTLEHIAFVNLPQATREATGQQSLSDIFGIFSYKQEDINQLLGIRYVLKNAAYHPAKHEPIDDYFLDQIGLGTLRKLMKAHQQVRIFLFSDDEQENISATLHLLKDEICTENGLVHIYCHAQRTPKNLSLQGLSASTDVQIIDSSYLSVASLKMMKHSHPINFVDIDTPATGHVASPFTAMIVGFGETGQETLKFLYEFGAFLGKDNQRSDFKCYCIDPQMDSLQAEFLQSVPALKAHGQYTEYQSLSYKSKAFWEQMERIINELNYVVVCVGNDEEGLSLTLALYDYANRYRHRAFDQFHIFLCASKDHRREELHDIVRLHNEMARYDASSVTVGEQQERGRTDQDVITVFGESSAIFTYDLIISNRIQQLGDTFKNKYNELVPYHEDKKPLRKMQKCDFLQIQSRRRKDLQNFNNALHIHTKALLAGGYERIRTQHIEDDPALMAALAMTEHLRWNASHEMMGYLPMSEEMEQKMSLQNATCNEQVKTHCCLKEFDELTEEYQRFDDGVVTTTLAIVREESSPNTNP